MNVHVDTCLKATCIRGPPGCSLLDLNKTVSTRCPVTMAIAQISAALPIRAARRRDPDRTDSRRKANTGVRESRKRKIIPPRSTLVCPSPRDRTIARVLATVVDHGIHSSEGPPRIGSPARRQPLRVSTTPLKYRRPVRYDASVVRDASAATCPAERAALLRQRVSAAARRT